jgi:DNA recombination protein RmuC
MSEILWALGGLLLGGIIFLFFRRPQKQAQDSGGMMLLQNQILELTKVIDSKLHENSKMVRESLHTQFGESQRLIKDITEELTSVKETGRRVEGFAEQLQSLQDILKNPKQRGILGEYYLETLLKNVLPMDCYQMQYPFPDGTIVDAAVFVKDKIIPIDSKFSLENYNRLVEETDQAEKERLEKLFISDLKNRILETSKYIQPENGTMEFAFMFIPHEAIYYDLLINKIGALRTEDSENLLQRAAAKYKVIIVSPTSFLAYLQTVLQGLNSLKIEEKAKDIIGNVAKLRDHLKAYEEYHTKLGNSLGTVVNHYTASSKEFKKVDKDILRVTGQALDVDLPLIDKPDTDV